jgi:glycosyltransferase involved in cell wall biosynthesis
MQHESITSGSRAESESMTEKPEPPALDAVASEVRSTPNPETAAPQSSGLNFQKAGAIARMRSLERQIYVTEQELEQALEKLRSSKSKRTEAAHYRSLIHRLRQRWYLRPFIPASALEPRTAPLPSLSRCWQFRGPRFGRQNSRGRLRVAIVGHQLSEELFGAEQSLVDVINAIDPDRFDIFAVFPQKNDRVFELIQDRVQGICIFPFGWWHKNRLFQEQTVRKFEELYTEQRIDLVHANTITLSDPLIAALRAGIPGITHAREVILNDNHLASQLGMPPTEIAKTVCRNASYVLANSAITLANYPCGERASYLHNSIDPCAFDLPNIPDPAVINVGLVSSNLLKKGIFDFVELARQAEKYLPSLKFWLIGPVVESIQQLQAEPPSLPRNLFVRKYISPPPTAYRHLNIVLNLSHFAESFGRTVAEAMTARRPVIAYRYGALPELVTDGVTGFLVPFQDLGAILDRLSFFAHDPGQIRAFGERAREKALALFSPKSFSTQLNDLYARLISERQPAASG